MKAYMYETMYILRPDMNEEAVDGAIGKYQSMLKEQGGTVIETQHRGKRRLAYEIDRHREGIYIQMNYNGPGAIVAPLERAMRLSDEVDSLPDRQAGVCRRPARGRSRGK